jgi:hypothetical protein
MSEDPKYAIFSQRAAGPRLLSGFAEPLVRTVVLNMRWINLGNQNVDVEQKRVISIPHPVGAPALKSPSAHPNPSG